MSKICTKCKIDKPMEAFGISSRIKCGRVARCFECQAAYRRYYYGQLTSEQRAIKYITDKQWFKDNPIKAKLAQRMANNKYKKKNADKIKQRNIANKKAVWNNILKDLSNFTDKYGANRIEVNGDITKMWITDEVFTIIDTSVYDIIKPFSWKLDKPNQKRYNYVTAKIHGVKVALHRLILGISDPKKDGDHINGNGLDNRLSNLRTATRSENTRNAGLSLGNTSTRKGVSWHYPSKRWQVGITINGKRKHLGLAETIEEAGEIYDEAARLYFGEFARTNEQILKESKE